MGNGILLLALLLLLSSTILSCESLSSISVSKEPPKRESYTVISGGLFQTKRLVTLTTVASWKGTESRDIKYKPPKAP